MKRPIFDWFTDNELRRATFMPIQVRDGLDQKRERCFVCEETVKDSHYRLVTSGDFQTMAWVCLGCWYDVYRELIRRPGQPRQPKHFEIEEVKEARDSWNQIETEGE